MLILQCPARASDGRLTPLALEKRANGGRTAPQKAPYRPCLVRLRPARTRTPRALGPYKARCECIVRSVSRRVCLPTSISTQRGRNSTDGANEPSGAAARRRRWRRRCTQHNAAVREHGLGQHACVDGRRTAHGSWISERVEGIRRWQMRRDVPCIVIGECLTVISWAMQLIGGARSSVYCESAMPTADSR